MPKKIQDLIDGETEYFMSQGFNKSQAKSLAWSAYWEDKQAEIEGRYQGNFDANYTFDCYCHDCKTGNQFKAADTIRLFIYEHKDHKTTTRKLR